MFHRLILGASVIELIAMDWVTKIYLYFPRTEPYVHILVIIFFTIGFQMSEGSRLRNNKLIVTVSVFFLFLIPILFYRSVPVYSFEEARLFLEKHEKIESVDDARTAIYSEKLRPSHYVITTGKRNNEKVAFIFEPFTGEYVEIESDM